MATSTSETVDEVTKQKLLELGYLIPPQIDNCDQTFTLNDTVLLFEKKKEHSDRLEAAEHQETARYVELFDCNGQRLDIEKALLTVHTKKGDVPLSFGNIIALAGDFYMNKEPNGGYHPISDVPDFGTDMHPHSGLSPMDRFNSAATCLFVDREGYLKNVHDLITSEHHALHAAIKAGDSTAAAYHDPGHAYPHGSDDHCHIPTEEEFIKATSSWYGKASSIYAWCAYTNVDHFGEHAIMAYCLGHTRALQLARLAQSKSTDAEKTKQLRDAYAHEAFAAHFLTDLFSSGHLRSPRRPLHNPNYFSMGANALQDKVVWDFMCRYMHDDDSATGILVRNQLGHQWIAYGDKQFMEPQACVNRARCMACLNESAKEVYKVGFKSNRLIDDDWNEHKGWFAAMKLIPQPMTAITPQDWTASWGGYDMHNPAPLILSEHAEAHNSKGWTFRNNLDDHSNYGLRQLMSPDQSKYGQMLKTSEFNTIGQSPLQSAIEGLLSGGFIQIQDLNAGSGKGICINFWSPATVKIGDKTESTFTIRNRLIDQQIAPTGKLIHWMREPEEQTGLAGFSWAEKGDDTGDVLMSSTFYDSYWLYKGPSDGSSAPFHGNKSWALERKQSKSAVTILTGVPKSALNFTRFVTGNFVNGPEILALSQIEKQASIGVCGDTLTYAKVNLPDAPYGFVKTFRGSNTSKDSAMLARGGVKEGANNVELAFIGFDDAGTASVQTAAFDLETEVEQDFSILVGDVRGWGYHQVAAIAIGSDVATIGLYGQSAQERGFKLCGLHQCELPHDMELVGPILTALMPSSDIEASRKGHDVLQISRQKSGKDSYITFRTHFQQGDGEDPFSGCDESWVHDGLASQGNQHYFSIKWMPVRLEDKSYVRSILEVYSWFGVVGVRVFTTSDGVKYDLIGQLPHLGQTSIGAGLGCYGDWGHGFVTWSHENEWVDCNFFFPLNKQDRTVGSWGMTLEDMERPYIAGWDVKRRPLK